MSTTGQVVAALPDTPSTPFHLFFPTRIGSGLPFLLHGYFEVDAARTGFYEGSAQQNEAILVLSRNSSRPRSQTSRSESPSTLISLPDLLGEGAAPENARALDFRDRALAKLDDIAWVPVEPGSDGPLSLAPLDLLVDEDIGLVERIVATFSPAYVHQRTEWHVPARRDRERGASVPCSRDSPTETSGRRSSCCFGPAPEDLGPRGERTRDSERCSTS